jgi:galactonate dehydratase
MRITGADALHADAGWRNFSFLKLSTDADVVGWSEYQEGFGSPGVTAVIEGLADQLVGREMGDVERTYWDLYALTRPAAGGVVAQALGAIENALLDAKAKALGVPAVQLLGGRLRERIRVYWSHCATYRVMAPEAHGTAPVRSLDDVRAVGAEVRARGFTALKTNIFLFDRTPALWAPGFNVPPGEHGLNAEADIISALTEELAAFRDGAGDGIDILLDLNFNFRTEGFLKVVRALDDLGLFWIEIDTCDPAALALIRRGARTPISSGETLIGLRGFRPYLEARAMDTAIVDAVWNGVWQSLKIAAAAEAYETNVAPHNFYGHLSTMMNAHFVAALPNFRIMETDVDQVPWRDELFTHVPEIVDGHLILPDRPGWGTEPVEAAIRAHPPKAGPMMRLER